MKEKHMDQQENNHLKADGYFEGYQAAINDLQDLIEKTTNHQDTIILYKAVRFLNEKLTKEKT